MAQVIGGRTTNQVITNENGRLVRLVDDVIYMLEEVGPLITLLGKMKKTKPVDSPRVEWFESDYTARWSQNITATVNATTTATTLAVPDGTLFVVGDVVLRPKPASSSAQPEAMRVSSIAGNTITVVRAVNGVIDTINVNDALRLIGIAFEEGSSAPPAKTVAPAVKTSYTQIFRATVDVTYTLMNSKLYGGKERARLNREKMVAVKEQMNAALLWGTAKENLTGGPNSEPLRYTQGLNSTITTNIYDANTILTRKGFESFSRMSFRYGKKKKILLASPIVCSAINEWGVSFLQVRPAETRFGVQIQEVTTAHGQWMVVNDWMLENGISGQNGFGNLAFSIDLDQLSMFHLQNQNVRIREDIKQDGVHKVIDEVTGEIGYQIKQQLYHAKLINVSDYQA